jgi:hypothetical protein
VAKDQKHSKGKSRRCQESTLGFSGMGVKARRCDKFHTAITDFHRSSKLQRPGASGLALETWDSTIFIQRAL